MRYSAGVMAGDRALSEAMFERPEMMRAGAEGVEMPELLDRAGRPRAGRRRAPRREFRWEDVPGLDLRLGRALVDGKVGPLEMSWERYLAIILDGAARPGRPTPLPD